MLARLAQRLPFYYGWLVVAVVFVTMAIGVNARTAFSLLYPPILGEFGWDRGVTAGVFSFGFLLSALLSPLFGGMMDSRGPRTVTLIGIAATAAGLLLAARSSEPSAARTSRPKTSTISASPSEPGATASRAARSASATAMPNASKRRLTSLLPEATPPVMPMM